MQYNFSILPLRANASWAEKAAAFFAPHWNNPIAEFQQSIAHCIEQPNQLPQYYIAVHNNRIVGGIGVCVNDDHNRCDLTPNICDLWVEPEYRNMGLAGKLLKTAEEDMLQRGITTLYLVTEHTSFYERYGWTFVCNVNWKYASDPTHSRLYEKRIYM